MASQLIVIVGIILGVGALFGVIVGCHRWNVYRTVASMHPTDVGRIDSPGLLEVEGSVVAGDSFEAPLTGQPAVLVAWEVEEWDESGKHSSWKTLGRGVRSVPFAVDDGTGRVTVDVDDHDEVFGMFSPDWGMDAREGVHVEDLLVEFDSFPDVDQYAPSEEMPDHVRQVEREIGIGAQSGSITNVVDLGKAHGERRYYEQAIGPGDHVYVRGEAVADRQAPQVASDDDREAITERYGHSRPEMTVVDPAGEMGIVSDLSEESLKETFARSYRLLLAGGTVSFVLAFVVALVASA